jgi:hypothetical protein
VALGGAAGATGENSTAVGVGARAEGDRSSAFGFLAEATQFQSIILGAIDGVNNADFYADVGIGTQTPIAPLHVSRNDGTANLLVSELSGVSAPRTLFSLINLGNTKFEITEAGTGNTWAFTNSGNDFRISLQDSGIVEFRVDNNGNAFLSGLLQENSDRDAKTDIVPVDSDAVLQRVVELPIAHWTYKDDPGTRHIGPMAQDFHAAFGTGPNDTSLATMDGVGVAIASVQALNRKLEARNRELEDRVARLEALVERLAPRVAVQ